MERLSYPVADCSIPPSFLNDTLLSNKGVQNGKDSLFRNDTLIEVENYRNGKKWGRQFEFYDSTIIITHFENDCIHGQKLEYSNDMLTRKSNYKMGIKSGVEYEYDKNGAVINTIEYQLDTNVWHIPHRLLKQSSIKNYKDSLISVHDYIRNNRVQFKGVISIFPSEDIWIWPEEVIHPTEVNNECVDCHGRGRYYIIELWGGDNLDQIWVDTWFVYTVMFDSKYEFIKLD